MSHPLGENFIKVQQNLAELDLAITQAIDKICIDNDYQITYAEINFTLTKILERNIHREIRDLQNPKVADNG